jgi:hypothetical protein
MSTGIASAALVALAVGCGENAGSNEPLGDAPVSPTPGECLSELGPDGTLLLRANTDNNYQLTVDVTIRSTEFAPGTGLVIDWSELTQDFFKHDLMPGDITNITVGLWAFSHEELIQHLKKDTLASALNVGGLTFPIDGTTTSIPVTEMYLPYQGNTKPKLADIEGRFDPEVTDPATHSYTISVNKGDSIKTNVKMIHHGKLNPASTNRLIKLTNDSAAFGATAVIASRPPILVPPNSAAITVSWKDIATNAIGEVFEDRSIDRVRVLHFPDPPNVLESKVLDLEKSWDREYKGPATGDEQEVLSSLANANGEPFTGIDPSAGGTWMVALMCAPQFCGSPAPWFMARLEACAE